MVIVGGGRVGSVFARSGVRVVHRDELVPSDPPILLCTQASHLRRTLDRYVPPEVRRDCVFMQNGAWEPMLDAWGIPDATRGALWFAAPGRGAFTTNRPSLFWGEHAPAVVALLQGIGVPAEVLPDRAAWRLAWAEKLLWSAIFGLLGERDGGTAGDAARRPEEIRALVEELAPAIGLPLDIAAIPERLCAYSQCIHDFPVRFRELELRNGWIIREARQRGVPTPLHDAAVRVIGRPEVLEALLVSPYA